MLRNTRVGNLQGDNLLTTAGSLWVPPAYRRQLLSEGQSAATHALLTRCVDSGEPGGS
jgi:hypothetical protein